MHRYKKTALYKRETHANVEFSFFQSPDSKLEDLHHDNPGFAIMVEAVENRDQLLGFAWSVYDKDKERIVRRGVTKPDPGLSAASAYHCTRAEAAKRAAEEMRRRLMHSYDFGSEVVISSDYIKAGKYIFGRTGYSLLKEAYETRVGKFLGVISSQVSRGTDGIFRVAGYNWDIKEAKISHTLDTGYVASTTSKGVVLASNREALERAAKILSHRLTLLLHGDASTFKIAHGAPVNRQLI